MEIIKKVPKTAVEIIYKPKNTSEVVDISRYIENVVYKDYEKDQSDEIELRIILSNSEFLDNYYPQKGSKISAKIGYTGEELLNCGIFTVDEISLESSSAGDYLIIRALAASINEPLREKNTRYFIGKTLIQIASEIGERHGYTVGGSEGFIKIPRIDQYKESDIAFLRRLAESYGYIFKLTDTVITFTKTDNLEQNKPLTVLGKKDISYISLNDTSIKTYNACSVKYYDFKKGKYLDYTVKGTKNDVKTETLKLDIKCQTKEEAIQKAQAALKTGQRTIDGSVTLKKGNRFFIAGANYTLQNYGILNGKYHIKSSTHNVSLDNYEVSGEVFKVD